MTGSARAPKPTLARTFMFGNRLAILHDHDRSGVALDSCSLDEFEARTGLRPPRLADVLDWAAGRVALDVELKDRATPSNWRRCSRVSCGATVLLPEVKLAGERSIAEATAAGLELIVWGLMAAEHSVLLGDERVAGVITDDVPGALAARLEFSV